MRPFSSTEEQLLAQHGDAVKLAIRAGDSSEGASLGEMTSRGRAHCVGTRGPWLRVLYKGYKVCAMERAVHVAYFAACFAACCSGCVAVYSVQLCFAQASACSAYVPQAFFAVFSISQFSHSTQNVRDFDIEVGPHIFLGLPGT